MNADNLDLRLLRFRSRRDEYPHALASALLDAGRIPEALEVVQVGLLQSENDGALLVLEGRAWFEQGDLPQAQAALLRAAKVTPREKEPYRWLAQVLMKRGEPARAVQVLERALQLDPTDRTLQQAHMRAQRLSKIANEADHAAAGMPLPASLPAPPQAPLPAPRPAERAKAGAGGVAGPAAGLPAPPKAALPPAPRAGLPQPPMPRASVPQPPARAAVDPQSLAQPTTPRRAVRLQQQASAAEPAPRDPVSDSAPPLELSRPRDPSQEHEDDEPTLAAELPEELRTWLDAERTSQEPVLALSSSNDNYKRNRARERVPPPPPWDETDPGIEESEPTLAVHSAELRLAGLDDSPPPGVIVSESLADEALADEPTRRAHAPEELAPVSEPEQPEQVLDMLRAQGIFEGAPAGKDSTTWVPKGQAPRAGSRIGGSLAIAWLLALSAAGGGYYGFMRWLDARRGDARSLIERAEAEARDGQYESLLAAERHLTQARSLDPKSSAAVEALLFVHATRALEAASGEMGYLRNTLVRAKEKAVAPALIGATEALLAAYEGDAAGARAKAEAALSAGGEDARVLFLVGRLYQRAGLPEAPSVLERAITRDAAFGLAWLARGEIALEEGKVEGAREAFAKARGEDGRELRAELWTIVVDTDATRAPALKQELKALAPRIERGSASDKLLAVSARAGLALALGDVQGARDAVREGSKLHGVRAPELTALFAERALAVGELELAYHAASSALRAAPGVRRYRDTLASVLLRRGDGRAALAALEGAAGDDVALLSARARAALLVGAREPLEAAKQALAAQRATPGGKDDPDVAALLLRVDLRLGASPESLLPAARALSQRAANAVAPQIALAEVAIQARQGPAALAAVDRARALAPDDADVDYLAGRAQRLIGKFDAARESLKRAIAIAPSHPEAREVLAGLLLDAGDYGGAYELFSGLERDGAGLSAELGAAEAQLYNGELPAAEKRFERLEPEDQARPGAQVLLAQLRLAQDKPSEAAKALEPLIREDTETRSADTLALYGDALFAEERVDSAAGAYDAALDLDANHPEALVGRAQAALRAEKTSQASELAAKAEAALITRLRPPRVHARLLLAQAKIAMLAQDLELARDKLAKAVRLQGVDPEAHFWLAETLAKTKSGGASEQYAKYLELDPSGYFAARAKKALTPR
jgi:Tfp pilus assembly protein PilF